MVQFKLYYRIRNKYLPILLCNSIAKLVDTVCICTHVSLPCWPMGLCASTFVWIVWSGAFFSSLSHTYTQKRQKEKLFHVFLLAANILRLSRHTHTGTPNVQHSTTFAFGWSHSACVFFSTQKPSKYYELYEMGFLICCFYTRSFFFSGCIICSTFSAVSSISTACSFSYPVRIKFCVIFYSIRIRAHCTHFLSISFTLLCFSHPHFPFICSVRRRLCACDISSTYECNMLAEI